MIHKEMYNLIGVIEKFKEEPIQTMRNDTTKKSPEYHSANGEAYAYTKVINHIYKLINNIN